MRRNRPRIDPDVSVVIPVVERFGDLKQIVHEFSAELARLEKTCEFIFVVDDSQRRHQSDKRPNIQVQLRSQ